MANPRPTPIVALKAPCPWCDTLVPLKTSQRGLELGFGMGLSLHFALPAPGAHYEGTCTGCGSELTLTAKQP